MRRAPSQRVFELSAEGSSPSSWRDFSSPAPISTARSRMKPRSSTGHRRALFGGATESEGALLRVA